MIQTIKQGLEAEGVKVPMDLELNLRIKPRKWLVHENPEAPTVPQGVGSHFVGYLAAARRPNYFFARCSAAIPALSFSSMYIHIFVALCA